MNLLRHSTIVIAAAAAVTFAYERQARAQHLSGVAPPGAASLLATSLVDDAGPFGGSAFGNLAADLADWALARRVREAERSAREAFFNDVDDLEGIEAREPLGLRLDSLGAIDPNDADSPMGAWLGGASILDAGSHASGIGCDLVLGGGSDLQLWERDVWYGAPPLVATPNGHVDKQGLWVDYPQIGRRWDRPESYAAYRYPVPNALVASGYDLDKPDAEQRRGKMSAVGHGGVDLVEKMGTEITMMPLDHQIGDAVVLFTGHFFGETVITGHARREGAKRREYILIFGHLDKVADGVVRGRKLRAGQVVGTVGNSDSIDFVHLHLEARRVREGLDAWKLGWRVTDRETSVVCDPRNVLPLRQTKPRPKCAPRLLPPRQSPWLERITLSQRAAWARPVTTTATAEPTRAE